ncbi:hypothetical protein GCM10027569_16680 [Flindersiella endophytica]
MASSGGPGGARLPLCDWLYNVENRAPLKPAAFLRVPVGSVRPQGWLAKQLAYELDGLCGRYPEVSHFLQYDGNGWIHPGLGGWEEVTYWLRGYVDLGYVTGDRHTIETAHRWIEGIRATQADDGFFGPEHLRTSLNGHVDLWPHLPMLYALRSYAEYTGDQSVDTFLSRFFAYANAQPPEVFRDGWATWRWGDGIDSIYWLYNRTGESFLLDLVHKIHANSADWLDNLPTPHNVNIAQGFREPAQYWLLTGDDAHRRAAYSNYENVQAAYGQFPGGGFAGDENAREGYDDPRQGFETCGIVEYMLSHEILTRITGDPIWGDRIEDLAFNSLPAALDPQGKVLHYIVAQNCVDLDDAVKTREQFDNKFAMLSYRPAVDQYRCCPHNYGMGWPYYVEEMWLRTPGGGLCAALYGPSTVTATVGDGASVTIEEETAYPFGDTITFTVRTAAAASFPLSVRIPAWCEGAELLVNGEAVTTEGGSAGPRYATVDRTWTDGDMLTLRLPMRAHKQTWERQHNATSVHYGPLTFSLRITENWVRTGGTEQWPEYDVHPGSAWNYGLVPDGDLTVDTTGGDSDDPFTPANAPIRITTTAQRIDAWQTDEENVVTPLQDSPVASTAPVEQVTLIPAGAARLRITTFPQTGGDREWGS